MIPLIIQYQNRKYKEMQVNMYKLQKLAKDPNVRMIIDARTAEVIHENY